MLANDQATDEISDLASKCIRCGFCLESCPTFAITGEETESPRGRIYLIRSADAGKIAWESTRPHLDRCLGCRACETACPSGVEYGSLLELARYQLGTPLPQKLLLSVLTRPSLFRWIKGRAIPAWFSRWISGKPPAVRPVPASSRTYPPLEEGEMPPIKGKVALLEGCAMRELFPSVHDATRRLLRRVGYECVAVDLGCCGALNAHSGMGHSGEAMAETCLSKARGLPVVVNSAGCGSWLKALANTDQPVMDVCEFLLSEGMGERLVRSEPMPLRVTYHDACHLAHGQGIREQPRSLLRSMPGVEFVEMRDSDRCCGSAGIYNITQPDMACKLLDQKWKAIEASGAQVVVMGNPGCHSWILQASAEAGGKIEVLHTVELLERSLSNRLRPRAREGKSVPQGP